MEWVEVTAKTIHDAQEQALDRLHVTRDEAEFEVIEEPKAGLFGRVRGEARVRARIKPTPVRPKRDRRQRQRSKNTKRRSTSPAQESKSMNTNEQPERPEVSPQEVADAATAFMSGLATAFGADAQTATEVDGTDIDVRVTGTDIGRLVGPGGRTLAAVQDLARVASQRRLGDHDTRLRIDVGNYRERRRHALEKFVLAVAEQVKDTGETKALEPMNSADRKVVHDALTSVDGVGSRSEGNDPHRRVIISPS